MHNIITKNYNRLKNRLRGTNRGTSSRDGLSCTVVPACQQGNNRIEQVCIFIKGHYNENITRDYLAQAVNLNPDSFSRLFNQYTGMGLTEYIYRLRVEEARKRLAETNCTVTRISMDTGFESIRTFNRAFRKYTGMSPVEYRSEYKLTKLEGEQPAVNRV